MDRSKKNRRNLRSSVFKRTAKSNKKSSKLEKDFLWKSNCPIGLRNSGMDCYINSLVQSLIHTPPLYNWLKSISLTGISINEVSDDGLLVYDLIRDLKDLEQNSEKPAHTKKTGETGNPITFLVNMITRIHDRESSLPISGFGEQDAVELLELIISSADEILNHEKVHCPESNAISLSSFLTGRTFSGFQCGTCETSKHRVDPWQVLQVPIVGDGLMDCIQASVNKEEDMINDDKLFCDTCKERTDSKRFELLLSLPQVLIVQFMSFEVRNGVVGKIQNTVDVPMELKLNTAGSTSIETKYILHAAVMHHGKDISSGHYSSVVRNSDGTFFLCDDHRVEAMSKWEKEQCFASSQNGKYSPYILFYVQE